MKRRDTALAVFQHTHRLFLATNCTDAPPSTSCASTQSVIGSAPHRFTVAAFAATLVFTLSLFRVEDVLCHTLQILGRDRHTRPMCFLVFFCAHERCATGCRDIKTPERQQTFKKVYLCLQARTHVMIKKYGRHLFCDQI